MITCLFHLASREKSRHQRTRKDDRPSQKAQFNCARRLGSRTGPQERRKEDLNKKGEGGGGGGAVPDPKRVSQGERSRQGLPTASVCSQAMGGVPQGAGRGGGGGASQFGLGEGKETGSVSACSKRLSAGSRGEFSEQPLPTEVTLSPALCTWHFTAALGLTGLRGVRLQNKPDRLPKLSKAVFLGFRVQGSVFRV